MKIILIRHGQTNYNAKRLIQGRVDEPLNNIGKRQARTAGDVLKTLDFNIDALISSPLSRALETGVIVGKKLKFKDNIILDYNFIERNFGKYELTTIEDNFPRIVQDEFNEEGYEDNAAIFKRISEGILNLDKTYQGKTVLIAAHAHVIRSFYILMDPNKYNFTNFFLGNGSIHIFEYKNDQLSLLETHLNEEE